MDTTSNYPDGLTAAALALLDAQVSVEIALGEPTSGLLDGSARERRNRRVLARALAGITPKYGVTVAQAVAESEVPRPVVTATVPVSSLGDALASDLVEEAVSGAVGAADVVAVPEVSALVEHQAERPDEMASESERAQWWLERADLLRDLRARIENPFTWERVQTLVEQAEAEGRRLLADAVSPWSVVSVAVA